VSLLMYANLCDQCSVVFPEMSGHSSFNKNTFLWRLCRTVGTRETHNSKLDLSAFHYRCDHFITDNL